MIKNIIINNYIDGFAKGNFNFCCDILFYFMVVNSGGKALRQIIIKVLKLSVFATWLQMALDAFLLSVSLYVI